MIKMIRMPLRNSARVVGARTPKNKNVQEMLKDGWIFIDSEKVWNDEKQGFTWVACLERDY